MGAHFKLLLLSVLVLLIAVPTLGLAQTGGTASGLIIGKIKDEFGRAIVGIDLSVFAYRQGKWLECVFVKVTDFLSRSARTLLSAETDLNGAFRFLVPAGSYLVRAFSGAEDVIDPEPEEVILESGEVATVSLVFDRPDRVIYGQVKIGGYGTQAPGWAWSDTGRYAGAK